LKKKISEQKCNYFSGKKNTSVGAELRQKTMCAEIAAGAAANSVKKKKGGRTRERERERERDTHTHTHTHTRARKIGPYPVKLNCANERGEV